MEITFDGHTPRLADGAWAAPNATLVGDVRLGERASVFYGAVLRADNEPITVGPRSNVQDNCVFHVDVGQPVVLGEGVSIGHGAVVHGATIGDHVLVGMNATVLNGAVIGDEVLVAAGALVPQGMQVPPRTLVAGVPGKVRRELTDDEIAHLHRNARIYEEHRDAHRDATSAP
ncbi:bacterial transferase hexapeptide repeat protein [Aeromicrobium marinum DSM 15272]|uniref:Bacterial transferase hexapeptide repeat protein n=1 Tax=Aeromicrobium marinum DSM 15272 TaxID=585531 RepID=E2SDG2_9ACTN|nr:DapH/DapD/GlmU-related protein [Aeromicrobium marinum]EFQ82539.1 bacterial transferase hexapeptide repeat protein [Aeromicrobium marinum DSM 15272]